MAYNGWQDRIAKSEVISDLNGVKAAMESARNWANGYPVLSNGDGFGEGDPAAALFTQSSRVQLMYYAGDVSSYCINATSTARPSLQMHLRAFDNTFDIVDGHCSS